MKYSASKESAINNKSLQTEIDTRCRIDAANSASAFVSQKNLAKAGGAVEPENSPVI